LQKGKQRTVLAWGVVPLNKHTTLRFSNNCW